MVWYYPNGKKNYRRENKHEWWLNGDTDGQPLYAEWIGQQGTSTSR